jgi:Mg-chelatase subunit ChlI
MSTGEPQQDFENMQRQLRALNEQIMESAKHVDAVYLDAYERTLRALADFQRAAAEATDDQRMRDLARAYADFTGNVTNAYVTAARELRK